MKLFILLLTNVLFMIGNITGLSQTFDGLCHSDDLSYILCCRHFELVNNRCIECKAGYHTFKGGTKCESCPENLYGKKCAFTCNCKENDRCDNINGTCIPRYTSTIILSEHLTSGEYKSQSTTEQSERGFSSKQAKDIAVVDSNQRFTKNNWPRLNYLYVTAGGASLIIICMCASFVLVKKRSRMSDVGITMPLVNEFNIPVLNQSVEAVSLNMLFHDYEEIDETVLSNIPEFRTIQFEENDSDSTEGSQSKPTEDSEGYLHPYHSLINPETRIKISNRNYTRQDGSTKMDHSQYDCLILSEPTGNQLTKSISIDAILKTEENRNECTISDRKTI